MRSDGDCWYILQSFLNLFSISISFQETLHMACVCNEGVLFGSARPQNSLRQADYADVITQVCVILLSDYILFT